LGSEGGKIRNSMSCYIRYGSEETEPYFIPT